MLSPAALRRLRIFARVGYVIVILLATLTHLQVDPDPERIAMRLRRALHWALRGSDVVDGARNVALFAGFGVIWLITSPADHSSRRVARITLLGFLLSFAVEAVQLLSESRTSSINDIATNTGGALLGALTIVVMVAVLRRLRPVRSYIGFPLYPVAGAYALAVATDIFAPFYGRERIYSPGNSIHERLAYALNFVGGLSERPVISLFDLVAGTPAGFLAVVALAELGMSYGAACAITVALGTIFSVGLEVAHGIAGQRIQIGAMVSHTVAISLGAVIAWRAAPAALKRMGRRQVIVAILLVASALLLAVWSWRPFELQLNMVEIRKQLSLPHLTPLGLMSGEVDLFGVADLIRQFSLYLALGVLLAVWPLRQHGRLAFVLPAIYLSIVLEVGQLFVVGRTFDVTDILTQCAAVAAGYVMVRRAGWGVVGEVLGDGSSTRKPQIIYPMSPAEHRSRRHGSRSSG
ncbi:MAG TPA: VanZ family protein [Gemmatimonadaceae bacterium]